MGMLISILLLSFLISCDSDTLPEPSLDFCDSLQLNELTYAEEISPILEVKCNNIGCHNAGSSVGDYTNYQGLIVDLDNGTFTQTVLIDRRMPQQGSPDLTVEELNMLECWVGNGYPEN